MYFKCILNLRAGPPGLNSTQKVDDALCASLKYGDPNVAVAKLGGAEEGSLTRPDHLCCDIEKTQVSNGRRIGARWQNISFSARGSGK